MYNCYHKKIERLKLKCVYILTNEYIPHHPPMQATGSSSNFYLKIDLLYLSIMLLKMIL
jgi:hypothetical protein